MRQVVVIHGGDSFQTRQRYLHSLRYWPVALNKFLPRRDWKAGLPRDLGRNYQVLMPQMPNKSNARYVEWKIWFVRMFPYLHHDVVLIGHSLGGIFLAKYLSENKFPKRIKGFFLVAAPHNSTADIGDFRLPASLRKVSQQCKNIILFFSQDDLIVPFSEMKRYLKDLPEAQIRIFKHRGHFNQPRFPEIVRLVKEL